MIFQKLAQLIEVYRVPNIKNAGNIMKFELNEFIVKIWWIKLNLRSIWMNCIKYFRPFPLPLLPFLQFPNHLAHSKFVPPIRSNMIRIFPSFVDYFLSSPLPKIIWIHFNCFQKMPTNSVGTFCLSSSSSSLSNNKFGRGSLVEDSTDPEEFRKHVSHFLLSTLPCLLPPFLVAPFCLFVAKSRFSSTEFCCPIPPSFLFWPKILPIESFRHWGMSWRNAARNWRFRRAYKIGFHT